MLKDRSYICKQISFLNMTSITHTACIHRVVIYWHTFYPAYDIITDWYRGFIFFIAYFLCVIISQLSLNRLLSILCNFMKSSFKERLHLLQIPLYGFAWTNIFCLIPGAPLMVPSGIQKQKKYKEGRDIFMFLSYAIKDLQSPSANPI